MVSQLTDPQSSTRPGRRRAIGSGTATAGTNSPHPSAPPLADKALHTLASWLLQFWAILPATFRGVALTAAITASLPLLATDRQRAIEINLPLNPRNDPYDTAVARMVRAIAEYSRWPADKHELTLCVVRPALHADAIVTSELSRGRHLVPVPMAARPTGLQACDALYIGQLPAAEQRRLTDSVRGRSVLTIAEADPGCRSQAMVCLVYEPDGLTFQLNIDAVSRSNIAIDPRVLRMASRAEPKP